MEDRASALIAALRMLGDPVALDLAGRLWRCQKQRVERRQGRRSRVDRPCRSVACPYCHRRLSGQWCDRAAGQMAHATDDAMSMVTIMLTRTGSLDSIRDTVRGLRVALRNLRDRHARRCAAQWRSVEFAGVVETDMMWPDDVIRLPPGRRSVIQHLPVLVHPDDILFVPHLHAVCHHPGLEPQVLHDVLSSQWPGKGRVDVRPCDMDDNAAANAGGVIAYAAKHNTSLTLSGDVDVEIPMAWQARYFSWLHGLRAGLAPLRVRIRPMRDVVGCLLQHVGHDDGTVALTEDEDEAMPVVC